MRKGENTYRKIYNKLGLIFKFSLAKKLWLDQSRAMAQTQKNKIRKADNKEEREARLAEALRDNLRRRKQQSREQKSDTNKG